jgi:hypothetical protein
MVNCYTYVLREICAKLTRKPILKLLLPTYTSTNIELLLKYNMYVNLYFFIESALKDL